MQNTQASAGLVAMIIAIGAIIAAAAFASVTQQLLYKLAQRSENDAWRTAGEVPNGVKVTAMLGDRLNAAGEISENLSVLYIDITLQPGSAKVPVQDLIIEVESGTAVASLTYKDVTTNHITEANATRYTAIAIRDPDLSWYNFKHITEPTLVRIYINASAIQLGLKARTECTILLFPKHGVVRVEKFVTPSTYGIVRFINIL